MKYKRVITLENNRVIAVKTVGIDCVLGEKDLVSDLGNYGEVMNKDGTFSEYVPTQKEIEVKSYEKEKQQTLFDLEQIEKEIKLGMKTQSDYEARQAKWLAYHNANNPYV